MDFDGERVTFSNQGLAAGGADASPAEEGVSGGFGDGVLPSRAEAQRQLREFIRNFRMGSVFPYREQLLRRWRKREAMLAVALRDLQQYDAALFALLQSRPMDVLPLVEAAAKEALERLVASGASATGDADDDVARDGGDGPDGETEKLPLNDIHVVLSSDQRAQPIRSITADHVNGLVKVSGIVVSATRVRAKAVAVVARCTRCNHRKTIACSGPFSSVALPQFCDQNQSVQADGQRVNCGPNSYVVVPDACVYINQQTLKLQEAPEAVPTGEMPRNVLLSVERTCVPRPALPSSRACGNWRNSPCTPPSRARARVPLLRGVAASSMLSRLVLVSRW